MLLIMKLLIVMIVGLDMGTNSDCPCVYLSATAWRRRWSGGTAPRILNLVTRR